MSITRIKEKKIFCSVVMPVYNGERFLRKAIESVLNQTYTNFEFLIIENCSTDASVEIIKSYNDPRIRLIIENNCGQVEAYNRGFKEAKGEYIFVHDQDDISLPERFEKQLEYILKNKLDVVGSFFYVIDLKGKTLTKVFLPISQETIQKTYYYKVIHLYNPTLCINKDVFTNFGFFEKQFFPSSDFEFILRIIENVKVGNAPYFLLKWRNHKFSLSHKNIKFGTSNALSIALKYLHKHKSKYSKSDYVFIKANIYYYYNKLLKSLYVLLKNPEFLDKHYAKLILKIVFFFIPIKILRVSDFFNTKIIYLLRGR